MEMQITEESFKEIEEMTNSIASLGQYTQDFLYSEMAYAAAQRFTKLTRASHKFDDYTGRLRKSIKTVRQDIKTEDGRIVKKGSASASMGGRGARHAHLLEWGTKDRTQKSTGRKTGSVHARHMMTDAFETGGKDAVNDAIRAGKKNFQKLINAAKGRGKLNKSATRRLAGF